MASSRPQTDSRWLSGGESHSGKKILWPQGRAGSSPALGIQFSINHLSVISAVSKVALMFPPNLNMRG